MKLILLPGLDGTGRLFEPLLDAFGDSVDCEVVSYPTDKSLGYGELAERVLAVVSRNEDCVILGESFSSPLAIRVAATRPANLRGVILSCGFARNPRPALGAFPSLLPLVPIRGRAASLARNYLLGAEDFELRRLVEQSIDAVTADVIRDRLREIAGTDVRDELSGLTLPLLYLKAENDRLVPGGNATEIGRLLPNAVTRELSGPHLLLQVRSDECAAAIRHFLDSC